MTVAGTTVLLARTHWQMLVNKAAHGLAANKLLVITVGGFLAFYAVAAYKLVAHGLDYVMSIPLLGPLLAERLVYLLFFFFFVMLVLSNATITGMGLFRNKDMEWQVALPLAPRSLVMWKTLEGMLLASWGLLVLSAPILLALGRLYEAGSGFFVATVPALICLVTIAANLSTWMLLLLVRFARRWWWKPAAFAALLMLGSAVKAFITFDFDAVRTGDVATGVSEILKHTEICMHPLLPSSWVAEVIYASGRGTGQRALFFNLVLLSHAMAALVLTTRLAGVGFTLGIFLGLAGILVCSFLGGMRAVTWTQVAQYIVLIVAYLVPVVWLAFKQAGPSLPVLDYGSQLQLVAEREKALLSDPREHEVIARWHQRAAAAEARLRDVPAAMAADALALKAESERLRAEGAPLLRIQQVERQIRQQPRSVDEARQRYVADRQAALVRAQAERAAA